MVHPLTHARPQHRGGVADHERWGDGGLVVEPVPVQLGDHQCHGDGLVGPGRDLGTGLDGALVVEDLHRDVELVRRSSLERDHEADGAVRQGAALGQPRIVRSGPHQRSRDWHLAVRPHDVADDLPRTIGHRHARTSEV